MAFVPAVPVHSTSAAVAASRATCLRGARRPASAAPARAARREARAAPRMLVISAGSIAEMDKILEGADDSLVVVDYSTSWCGPCKMFEPIFEELSDKYTDVVFVKVLGDATTEANDLMVREGIRAVPAFHFWKGQERIKEFTGARKDDFQKTLEELR